MSTPTWGLDPKSRRISVYYTEASTIYEGMPVCYEFDATTNWMGVDGSKIDFTTTASTASLESTTTAEGYQNEGKFIRVEDPDDDNIHAFAGVVAGGDHVGQTGPRAIDIYIPNGAIVPVRTDQNCSCGKTILCVHNGEQHLTGPYGSAGRPVAIAQEDDDNSSAAAITLAKLDPNLFLYQKADATSLNVDDQDAANGMVLNRINVTTASTAAFCAFECRAYSTAGAYANSTSGGGLAAYFRAQASSAGAASLNAVHIMMSLTGGTPSEYVRGLHVKLHEDGATMTSANKCTALTLELNVADDVKAHNLGYIYLEDNGAQAPDNFILSSDMTAMAAEAFTGTVAIGAATAYGIRVYLSAQPGTQQWYIPLLNALS